MPVNLFTFIGLFDRLLTTTAHILEKGAAHAAANGVSEADMLAWRLVPDMQPLAFQIRTVVNFARQWPARVADLTIPKEIGADLGLAEFQSEIAGAKAYLASLTAAQFEGRDEAPLTHTLGSDMTLTLPRGQWLTVFAATNLYFHVSTAYGILRAHGVPIGKPDLFAGGL